MKSLIIISEKAMKQDKIIAEKVWKINRYHRISQMFYRYLKKLQM